MIQKPTKRELETLQLFPTDIFLIWLLLWLKLDLKSMQFHHFFKFLQPRLNWEVPLSIKGCLPLPTSTNGVSLKDPLKDFYLQIVWALAQGAVNLRADLDLLWYWASWSCSPPNWSDHLKEVRNFCHVQPYSSIDQTHSLLKNLKNHPAHHLQFHKNHIDFRLSAPFSNWMKLELAHDQRTLPSSSCEKSWSSNQRF